MHENLSYSQRQVLVLQMILYVNYACVHWDLMNADPYLFKSLKHFNVKHVETNLQSLDHVEAPNSIHLIT